jgi:hypothetical protein
MCGDNQRSSAQTTPVTVRRALRAVRRRCSDASGRARRVAFGWQRSRSPSISVIGGRRRSCTTAPYRASARARSSVVPCNISGAGGVRLRRITDGIARACGRARRRSSRGLKRGGVRHRVDPCAARVAGEPHASAATSGGNARKKPLNLRLPASKPRGATKRDDAQHQRCTPHVPRWSTLRSSGG